MRRGAAKHEDEGTSIHADNGYPALNCARDPPQDSGKWFRKGGGLGSLMAIERKRRGRTSKNMRASFELLPAALDVASRLGIREDG